MPAAGHPQAWNFGLSHEPTLDARKPYDRRPGQSASTIAGLTSQLLPGPQRLAEDAGLHCRHDHCGRPCQERQFKQSACPDLSILQSSGKEEGNAISIVALPTSSPIGVNPKPGRIWRMRAWLSAFAMTERRADAGSPHPGRLPFLRSTTDEAGKPSTGVSIAGEKTKSLEIPRRCRVHELRADLCARFSRLWPDVETATFRPEVGPQPLLWIDETSYVAFEHASGAYQLVLEEVFGSRVTLDAHEFEAASSFVRHYVVARLMDAATRTGAA